MEIHQKLRNARTRAGLTQDAVAEQLGVSRQTMSNWENGRSNPDIGNILKLSELYGISLDALLKDPAEEAEGTVHFLKKYWYALFSCAVLTYALSGLADYYGFPTLALVLLVVGLLLFCLPRLLYHRLFGGGLGSLLYGIIGWCITFVCRCLLILDLPSVDQNTLIFWSPSMLNLIGCSLVGVSVSREYEAKKRKTSWTMLALCLIPALIIVFDSLSSAGAFSKANPFGHTYRVEQVLYQADTEAEKTFIKLPAGVAGGYLYLVNPQTRGSERIGEFTYAGPDRNSRTDTRKGIWQIVPEEDETTLYRLTVEADDSVTLSCSIDEQLQWKYRLDRIDVLTCTVSTVGFTAVISPDWYETGTFDGSVTDFSTATVNGEGKLSFRIDDPAVESLTLYEEYYHDGEAEQAQYILDYSTPLPEFNTRYPSGEQYAIYRIPYKNGEFIFHVKYTP